MWMTSNLKRFIIEIEYGQLIGVVSLMTICLGKVAEWMKEGTLGNCTWYLKNPPYNSNFEKLFFNGNNHFKDLKTDAKFHSG